VDHTFLLFALIVLLSYTTHALSGFGSMIIAVTLGMHLYPIDTILPILVPLDIVLNAYLMIRHRRLIERRLLLLRILPFMGVGLLAGIALFNYLHSAILKIIYGCFIILVSARELYIHCGKVRERRSLSRLEEAAWLITGGIFQGVFASGGPPVVYVSGRILPDKSVFRSTLSTLWVALNSVLAASFIFTGRINQTSLSRSAMLVPVVILCIVLGERLHIMVDERKFRIIVFALLLCAGIALILR
jgi:uncharacterized membrane protein YfcA